MKKSAQETVLYNKDFSVNKNQITNKTTNINILLNRVKLDKKKTLRKKFFFVALAVSFISVTLVIAII
mgnify:CR=1 FL=1|jgi:hypothetical protein|tara:strand:+ start:492 stop:695 length:204 start_codon:yes stop_codon:yes gene_type:complete